MRADLIVFLRARLAEDETMAWLQDEHQSGLTHPYDLNNPCDPTRVLADIAAKRRLLALHAPHMTTVVAESDWLNGDIYDVETDSFEEITSREVLCLACLNRPAWPCETVLILAQPYSGRPDSDSSWRI